MSPIPAIPILHLNSVQQSEQEPSIQPQSQHTTNILSRGDHSDKIFSIPSTYGRQNSSPAPGTVAGIIIGSVAGFIFLLYLLFLAISSGRNRGTVVEESLSDVRRRPSRRRRGGGSADSGGMVEVLEEHDEPPRRSPRSRQSNIVVDESVGSRTEDSNMIEVEEEHSSVGSPTPPPRRGGRGRRGSYRTVDPYEYGGEGSSYGGSRY